MAWEVVFLAGAYNVQVMRLNSRGLAVGQASDPETPTVNTVYGAYVADHTITLGGIAPTRTVATDRGGQTIRGKKDLGPEDFATLALQLSDWDSTFNNIISGSQSNDDYVTGWRQGSPHHLNPILPQVAILFTSGTQDRGDESTDGYRGALYIGTIAPTEPGANQNGGVNPNPIDYTLTPTVFAKLHNGIPLETLNLGYTENIVHDMETLDRVHWTTFVADGNATTFKLPYLPKYNDATGSARNWIVRIPASAETGANTAVTSVNITTGVVTLASAGSSGDLWILGTPTNFIPSP